MSERPQGRGRARRPVPQGAPVDTRLLDPGWTPDGVPAIARSLGLGRLGDHHWKVIGVCREEAARTGHAVRCEELAALTGFECTELRRLFPGDFDSTLARVAGLLRHGDGPAVTRGAPRSP